MATMATAMATASAKPSMRDVLGLLIAFNSIARRHMHALHSGMDVKAYAASVGRAQPASRHPCRTAVVVAGAGPQSKRPPGGGIERRGIISLRSLKNQAAPNAYPPMAQKAI
jgi:hypothetical protein